LITISFAFNAFWSFFSISSLDILFHLFTLIQFNLHSFDYLFCVCCLSFYWFCFNFVPYHFILFNCLSNFGSCSFNSYFLILSLILFLFFPSTFYFIYFFNPILVLIFFIAIFLSFFFIFFNFIPWHFISFNSFIQFWSFFLFVFSYHFLDLFVYFVPNYFFSFSFYIRFGHHCFNCYLFCFIIFLWLEILVRGFFVFSFL
jgi:hypothetical protein